jgi:hypothetical protein
LSSVSVRKSTASGNLRAKRNLRREVTLLRTPRGPRGRLLRWAWVPLLLTAFLRAAWLWRFPVNPLSPVDAEGFHLLARNLLDGHGFAIGWDPPFCPTAIRTPIYPLFVAGAYTLLGSAPEVVILCHILLETLTAGLVIALARRLAAMSPLHGSSSRDLWSLLAGVLYAVNGTTQRFAGYVLSELLLLPLLVAALLLTVSLVRQPRWTRAAAAGCLWGLVLLTKPNVQYLVYAVILLLMARLFTLRARLCPGPQRLIIMTSFCGLLLVTVAPWVLRNHLRFDRWLLSTAFGENVARVSVVVVQAALIGVEAEPWTATWEDVYQQFVISVDPAAVSILAPRPDVPCAVLDHHHRQVADAARRTVAEHSGLYMGLHLRGVARSLLDPGHRLWYRLGTGRDWVETGVLPLVGPRIRWSLERGAWGDALSAVWQERVVRIPWGAGLLWWGLWGGRLLVAWMVVRGLLRLRSQALVMMLFLGVVVYHLILPGPISHDRFYAPVVPLVVVLVAWGADGYNRAERLPTGSLGGGGGHDDRGYT